MHKLLEKILEGIKPSEEEHRREKGIIDRVEKALQLRGVRPLLVGSLAKKTDIRADKDIDIFILFDPGVSRKELEEKGLQIGREVFTELGAEYEIDYAEHPYIKGLLEGYVVEIVPCYETKKPKSAVDRTPYHIQYVKRKIRENRRLADEIRLMKQFMKGVGVYGAEAKVQGFSGYLTELLVIHYGSFEDALKAASGWKFNEILDPENLWEDKEALRFFFPEASLIVVDAVDENRNAAAAVSEQTMARFIHAAREFLDKPSRDFFFPPEKGFPSPEELVARMESRGTRFIAIEFTHGRINPNTLYSQLRKTRDSIVRHIDGVGFKVLKSGIWTDEEHLSVILLEFEVWILPPIEHRLGPPIDMSLEEQDSFVEKYKDYRPRIEKGRWVAEVRREIIHVEELISEILEERRGFGKNLRELEEISMVEDKYILKIDGKKFLKFLGEFT
ncbi:MAG: CCA tRNA nucleotidyltransferase [Candidatus Altiarchaeota archaeon]|nr:CCA tRNA nucleotidyltransferase [Candidatus Altiarchaeota archaeon]